LLNEKSRMNKNFDIYLHHEFFKNMEFDIYNQY